MNTPSGQYTAKELCRCCGSVARYIKTRVCVRCAIGRKEAAYERTLLRSKPSQAQMQKASSEKSKANIQKQLRRWIVEESQERQKNDRMIWEC